MSAPKDRYAVEEVLSVPENAVYVVAMLGDDGSPRAVNLRTRDEASDLPKYKRVVFSHSGFAFVLRDRLRARHRSADFVVAELRLDGNARVVERAA